MIWLIFIVITGACGFIIFRCFRYMNRIIAWMEPAIENSELGPHGSSPDRLLNNLPSRTEATPRIVTSFADELFLDSASAVVASPSSEVIMADGGGVFSSADRRANFRDSCVQPPVGNCKAHCLYPCDGSNVAVSTLPCSAVDLMDVRVLGGESICQAAGPCVAPSDGAWIRLCSRHKTEYEQGAVTSRCAFADCWRRGFPVNLHGRTAISCPVQFRQVMCE